MPARIPHLWGAARLEYTAMTTRLFFSGLLFIGVMGSPGPHGTLAYLSSGVQSTGNRFSAGTVHIANSLAVGATLSMANLIGGDNFDAQLDVANSGTLSLIYAVSTSLTGSAALGSTLQLTVRTKTTSPCGARDGAILYTGDLSSAAIGDPAHGLQAGDRVLAAGASESLCFTVTLPTSAVPSLVATNAAATFVFSAEQNG
jgi:hypothetical protein